MPAYWLVRYDVLSARARLNFSTLGAKPSAAQKATLYEAVNMVQLGAMPLPRFLQLHPDARVTPDQLATMKAYLAPWTSIPSQSASTPAGVNAESGNTQAPVSLAAVQPELDGFPFDPDFENWKPLSFTDRGDNYTFRFVLGNAIAVQAAQSGHMTPWPDGSRFAKVAWQQELGPDGLIHPGKFVQVELMLKNAQQYKSTEGWGWGRWRDTDLKPYGKDAGFVHECTGCHVPVRGNDFVYTLPMTNAQVPGNEIVNNQAAGLSVNLPYQPLGWNAITMYVDRINTPCRRFSAIARPCRLFPLAAVHLRVRQRIRQARCWGLLPGYNATILTGLARAFRQFRSPWSLCRWQPTARRISIDASMATA